MKGHMKRPPTVTQMKRRLHELQAAVTGMVTGVGLQDAESVVALLAVIELAAAGIHSMADDS